MTDPAPRRARDLARATLIAEIADTARRHLAESGAAGLSLRAVARELGMASSAIYRYFPSRDALLTRLIIDAYDALGSAAEEAEAKIPHDNFRGRFHAIADAVRAWARDNPHQYGLIYGSPVPGYAAPDDTIDPATRVAMLLIHLLADLEEAGTPLPASVIMPSDKLRGQLIALSESLDRLVDPVRMLAGIGAWIQLYGSISFELFGQFQNTFDDADALFTAQVDDFARRVGIPD